MLPISKRTLLTGALASNHALLTKPYRSSDLARKVRQLLDKAPSQ